MPGEREKELLGVLEERRELTPATAAMRTSLTVDEASKLLEDLSRKGHLGLRTEDGVMAYALGERGGRGPSGNIYRKLGTKNSAEALAHARDLKLLTRASPIEVRTDRAGVALGRSARRRRPG